MSIKANLKAAKAAIDTQDYEKAVVEAQTVLASDSQNHFAKLFLGRALEKQGKHDEAATGYLSAAHAKPEDSQAWLGLCSVYETQGSAKVDDYREAAVKAAEIIGNADDKHRCQTIIDKLLSFAKLNGSTAQRKRVLQVCLPGTAIYDILEGRIPHPAHTYLRLVELTEDDEAQRVRREIGERRTRIGARVGQVTEDVTREVLGSSDLESLYQQLINWTNDDEVRRQYEEKLLQRAYDLLVVLPADSKTTKLDQVLTIAEGMVIIKHPFQLAWDLVLESRDLDELQGMDAGILREYVALFPDAGPAKVLHAWLTSELSPFPPPPTTEEGKDADIVETLPLKPEDRLLLMSEGLTLAAQSPLAHRLVGDYYQYLEEHESAVTTCRDGLKAVASDSTKLGMTMQNTRDALNGTLATALVHYRAPRNHAEARRLFEDILLRKPHSTPALIGLGLIFEETEDYHDAIDFFTKAMQQDPSNVRVGTELAWCRALAGDYASAQHELEAFLPALSPKVDEPRLRDMRAQVLYRIGICIWYLDTSKSARKDRNGAYARFLAAIKTNVNFAPAYTSLGFYYSSYAKDKKRARQCFQKAFELSSAETDAAEHLAKSFADQGDWDIVEVIASRVIESGRARPPPGSKRKGLSWPYAALGVVQMNKQDYQQAIVSFLAALRISPDDYQSYIGLGESYHNSGRYNSALRTFHHALEPPEGVSMKINGETWFARYMLANVHRELGEYDEALQGLKSVLLERPSEFGVLMSLLQTYVEKAWRCLDGGLFGQAIDGAKEAIAVASIIAKDRPDAFNMWKTVGDACSLFSLVQISIESFPLDEVRFLLSDGADSKTHDHIVDVDHCTLESLSEVGDHSDVKSILTACLLAYKRAISSASHDLHAQAVAWYNLGWAEHRAYAEVKTGKRYLTGAVRCFKRAIELEAGNAEFWNALGVVTTTLNARVAQHAFVRSLHLNELNAKVWANLGVLYLLQNDHELAHQAFGRAQSTDPEYAHAWVGEGLIALLTGDMTEALNHFTHAFEISGSASVISKRRFALSTFDHLLSGHNTSSDSTKLVQPLFALDQLRSLLPHDLPYRHLAALFLERVGGHAAATEALVELCTAAEADYEASESLAALARFAQAKCDLARNELAALNFAAAAADAEIALDLSSDTENSGFDARERQRLRLSAHLTAGLAYHRLEKSSEAISMFRTALKESDSDPDIVCLLVKVLWAYGGTDEKSVGREQLFHCVEKHPEHVGSVTLLGAIAALDEDVDTIAAVRDDLLALRTKDGLDIVEHSDIESLLTALAGLAANDANVALIEAQAAAILKPDSPRAWTELAEQSGEAYAAEMALKASQKSVPPAGEMDATELAQAYASVGTVADAQRAVVLAPWEGRGWRAFGSAVAL